jgi:hypothetical protein
MNTATEYPTPTDQLIENELDRRDGRLDGPDDWQIGQDLYERWLDRCWGER